MIQSPKSLTATVHVRFNYQEPDINPAGESQVEMLNRILDQAADLDPALQECVIGFVNHLKGLNNKEEEAEHS